MKLKLSHSKFIVGGTMAGHPFLNRKNMASGGGAVVHLPIGTKFAAIGAKRLSAQRAAIKAGTPKG